ncbi:hypothetical protein Ddye_016244 [Dipteronia dyeriana]|uniref:Protein IQ-DOMAIN 1 n=1 Tax=Dipteronia dyeriana TaxID=168575 RepID=A0AAD9U6E5_9ROSI|nr:hypothetical protein Ddye_016244 [Dipteronia dyeriana]
MGITGELVKSVFSRSKSVGTQESSARCNAVEKRKWSSVRSYLCGDEFNSVLAEEDSASVKSSEATVTQPVLGDFTDKGDNIQSEEETKEKHNSISELFHEEDAAIIIQTAFRAFLARRRNEEIESKDSSKQEHTTATESPSKESIGTSIEVQTGNSVEVFSLQEETMAIPQRIQQKARAQVFKIKEDWDDSTVSSNISKMRIQSRLEATTRRERALAYAFSQQLRICSKKKHTRSDSDSAELNMGWSWLERWMATRLPESPLAENDISKQLEPFSNNQRFIMGKRLFDVAGEEKESCGSNDVSIQLDSFSVTAANDVGGFKSPKNKLKATRTVSRRKTVPSYQCPKGCSKVKLYQCSYLSTCGRTLPTFHVVLGHAQQLYHGTAWHGMQDMT